VVTPRHHESFEREARWDKVDGFTFLHADVAYAAITRRETPSHLLEPTRALEAAPPRAHKPPLVNAGGASRRGRRATTLAIPSAPRTLDLCILRRGAAHSPFSGAPRPADSLLPARRTPPHKPTGCNRQPPAERLLVVARAKELERDATGRDCLEVWRRGMRCGRNRETWGEKDEEDSWRNTTVAKKKLSQSGATATGAKDIATPPNHPKSHALARNQTFVYHQNR
jgi:hypothetical protein